ncbi:MAG: hypothetical protein H7249_14945 [Chitinophagaceae bacterium]|nr:hypothetical protein [Oligoflexus sp.]
MKTKSISLVFSFFLLAGLGCRSTSSQRNEDGFAGLNAAAVASPIAPGTDSTKPPVLTTDNITLDPASRGLGDGYDSVRKIKLSPCIDPTSFVYRGANASDLSFMQDYSYDQILNEVGVSIYAKASLFGLVSAKVQGDMATSLATTGETSSFIYNFRILGKSAVIGDRVLNINGMAAYHSNDLVHFRDVCGDLFVDQVKLGAQLFVGVKFTFGSKETKEKIVLTLKGSALWGLIKVSKTWSKEFAQLMQNVRISVDAFQVGGDVSKLEALKAEIATKSCAGDDVSACSEAVDRLLEYGRTGFSAQLADMQMSKSSTSGPAIVDVSTEAYNSQKVLDPSSSKLVSINIKSDLTTADKLAVVDAQLDRIEAKLKIALTRVMTLKDFDLTEDEKTTVKAAQTGIEGVLRSITALREGTCTNAVKDGAFVPSCASQAGLIESDADSVLSPIDIKR